MNLSNFSLSIFSDFVRRKSSIIRCNRTQSYTSQIQLFLVTRSDPQGKKTAVNLIFINYTIVF